VRAWIAPGIVILLTLLLVAWVLVIFSSESRPLRPVVVATSDWEPFVAAGLEGHGPIARLIDETMRRAGYRPVFQLGAWQEAQDDVVSGNAFAAFPFIRTTERERSFLFSEPLFSFSYVFFYKLPDHRPDGVDLGAFHSTDDLARFDVGLIEGYQLWGELAEEIEIAATFNDLSTAFEALDHGEIDLLGESRIVGERVLYGPEARIDATHFGIIEGTERGLNGGRQDLHLITADTDENARFMRRFDRALRRVRQRPLYAEIVSALRTPDTARGADRVRLASAPTRGRDPVSGRWLLLLRGTRASVVEWPEEFVNGRSTLRRGSEPVFCTVKVLDGPLRGRVLRVPTDELELTTRVSAP